MKRFAAFRILPAALFLLLGGCLLLAAAGMLSDAGVRRERVTVSGTKAELWIPVNSPGTAEITDDEDGHEHTHTVTSGGSALVLTGAFDGSRSLAAELARRGVTVLRYGGGDCAGAWRTLKELGSESGAMALLAGSDRAAEALELARELREGGERCAAVILLGNEATLRAAADSGLGNILILTRSKPDMEALTAFYGSRTAAERGFDGFFGEGTARACDWDREFGSFARRETLTRAADWKGSTLGHAVEIPDGDLVYKDIIFCYVGAVMCLLLAGGTGAVLLRRRREKD